MSSWRMSEVVEGLARRDPHLGDDEVDVGDLLGDGVLDLDAGVHLDEDVAPVLAEEELDRARVEVADRLGEAHGIGTHLLARGGVEVGRRRDLDDLLVAALHRAVALEEVQHGAGGVGEHLHLDVPRVDHRLLEVERRVAERGVGLALGRLERLAQRRGVVDPAHAAPAAAGDGLDEHREADALGRRGQGVEVGRRARRCARVGSPAARAAVMARDLLPVRCSAEAGGPMKVIPLASQASASSGFSERKP